MRCLRLAESTTCFATAIATMILEELENEAKWHKSFANSQDLLASLAGEAMEEYAAGETR